jgi:hypothetical protein
MSRTILAIGAVLVLGLAIGVWILSRPSDNASAEPANAHPGSPADHDDPRPSLAESGSGTSGTSRRTRARTGDDVVVHDHRTGDSPPSPDLVEPTKQTKRDRDLPSNLTFEVSRGVKAALEQCASLIPAGERTGASRLRGSIGVGIKDHVATIRAADLSFTGSTGPAADSAKQCVVQKSVGLQTPAQDQPDLESYSIEVSFRLP